MKGRKKQCQGGIAMRLVAGIISRSFICLLLMPCVVWLSCYWYKRTASCVHYEFSFPLSSMTADAITDQIAQQGNRNSKAHQLATECPIIKNITLEYVPQGVVCSIKCHEPKFIINNSHVVLSNYSVVTPELFSPELLHQISHIKVVDAIDTAVSASLFDCVVERSVPVQEQFALIWHHEWFVLYEDALNSKYSLLARADQTITSSILTQYHAIINSHKNNSKKKKHDSSWIVDIRFDNQIILCAQKGGQGYGKINVR